MIGARTKATYCTMYAIFVHDMGVNYACMRHTFKIYLSFMIGARTKATYCTMYAIYVNDMGVDYACMRHLYVKFINIVVN